MMFVITPGLTSFSNDENYVIFLFLLINTGKIYNRNILFISVLTKSLFSENKTDFLSKETLYCLKSGNITLFGGKTLFYCKKQKHTYSVSCIFFPV